MVTDVTGEVGRRATREDDRMAERWTRARRVEHTRNLLLDAAEEVFARRGLAGAALEDIADVAGYTRGAIYSHFGAKEELFLAVIERQRQRFLDGFADVISSFRRVSDLDLDQLTARWRDVGSGIERAALNYEFTLFLVRNPDARDRLAAQRLETVRSLGEFIEKNVARLGATLTMPAETLARVILSVNDGVTLGSYVDGEDLYRPYLALIVSSIKPSTEGPVRRHIDVPGNRTPDPQRETTLRATE
jgi:AcrR family transcriptional regulator